MVSGKSPVRGPGLARNRFARYRHSCDHVLAAREKGKRWRCRERHRGNFPASREKRDDASPREVHARPPSNFGYCGIVGQPRVIGACDMTGTAGIGIGSGWMRLGSQMREGFRVEGKQTGQSRRCRPKMMRQWAMLPFAEIGAALRASCRSAANARAPTR